MHKRTDPFEFFYFLACTITKKYKLSKQKRLPCKVVSIGNITVGGTGKTPAVIALAEEAKRRGLFPVILTRGYKGNAKQPVFVNFPLQQSQTSDKMHVVDISPEMLGDEAFMMAERLKDIPIVKFPDRYKGGELALEKLKPHFQQSKILFILDDGFQHWSLYRDVDIALVDGTNPFGSSRKLLPFGSLREQPYELKRADILLITKNRNEELFSKLKLINPNAPVFYSEYKVREIKYSDGSSIPLTKVKNKKVFAFCGIAQPESFRGIITSLDMELSGWKEFPDHYRYQEQDLVNIKKQQDKLKCDFLITTEKDIVKIRRFKNLSNLLYLDIEFSTDAGFYEEVFRAVL